MKLRIPSLLFALSVALLLLSACEEEGAQTTTAACTVGTSRTCEVPGVAGCNGTMTCGMTGAFGPCNVPQTDDCGPGGNGNGIDDNCNGQIDEGCSSSGSGDACTTPNAQESCLTSCDLSLIHI